MTGVRRERYQETGTVDDFPQHNLHLPLRISVIITGEQLTTYWKESAELEGSTNQRVSPG